MAQQPRTRTVPAGSCVSDNSSEMFKDYNFDFIFKTSNNVSDTIHSNKENFDIYIQSDTDKNTPLLPIVSKNVSVITRFTTTAYTLVSVSKILNHRNTPFNMDKLTTDDEIDAIFSKGYFENDAVDINKPYTKIFSKWLSQKVLGASYLVKKYQIRSEDQTFIGTAIQYITTGGKYALYDVSTFRNDTLVDYAILRKMADEPVSAKDNEDRLNELVQYVVFNPQ